MRKNNSEKCPFSLKENDKVKGRYGWIDDNGEWIVPPIYRYEIAAFFDFEKYFSKMEEYKKMAIEEGFNSERAKRATKTVYDDTIMIIQCTKNVDSINCVCENYNHEFCMNKTNIECMQCDDKYFDIKGYFEGGNNE